MKSRFWIVALLSLLATSLLLPQATTQAATVTYTTCPDFSTLETDASTPGTITFNIASPCTVLFDNEIYIDSAVTITNIGSEVVFDGNGEEYHFNIDSGGNLTLNNLVLYDGYGEDGGSIFNLGSLTVTGSVFDYNYADYDGGAIYNCCGTVTLTNTIFVDNEAGYNGGAIYTSGGTLTITNSLFDGNYVEDYGGAIYNDEGTIIISGSTFTDNTTDNDSGVMEIYGGNVTISNSLFYGNSVTDDGGVSYIYNDATVTISNSSFFNNYSDYWGGVFYVTDSGTTLDITNSTFYNNSSSEEGGAIHVDEGNVTLRHVTIASNTSGATGDNLFVDGAITVIASIIVDGDCDVDAGVLTDGGNNIQFLATGCVGTDTDPMLGAFAGGVMIPGDGSPAIDAMPACIVANDQLGTARPQGAACDIGAIEGGGGFVVPIPVDAGPIVLGCVFDTPSGMELSNVPDNTYCTVLMKNGEVVNYSGAVPAELIGLGVIFAVDVYRLEGGRSIVEFPDYGRICIRGNGRMFYMDARNAPRYPIEMTTERVDNMTCAWIPAAGTLILTEN